MRIFLSWVIGIAAFAMLYELLQFDIAAAGVPYMPFLERATGYKGELAVTLVFVSAIALSITVGIWAGSAFYAHRWDGGWEAIDKARFYAAISGLGVAMIASIPVFLILREAEEIGVFIGNLIAIATGAGAWWVGRRVYRSMLVI